MIQTKPEVSKLADTVVSAWNALQAASEAEQEASCAHTTTVNDRNRAEAAFRNAKVAFDRAMGVGP